VRGRVSEEEKGGKHGSFLPATLLGERLKRGKTLALKMEMKAGLRREQGYEEEKRFERGGGREPRKQQSVVQWES